MGRKASRWICGVSPRANAFHRKACVAAATTSKHLVFSTAGLFSTSVRQARSDLHTRVFFFPLRWLPTSKYFFLHVSLSVCAVDMNVLDDRFRLRHCNCRSRQRHTAAPRCGSCVVCLLALRSPMTLLVRPLSTITRSSRSCPLILASSLRLSRLDRFADKERLLHEISPSS